MDFSGTSSLLHCANSGQKEASNIYQPVQYRVFCNCSVCISNVCIVLTSSRWRKLGFLPTLKQQAWAFKHFVKNVKQYHNHKQSALVLEFIKLVKTKKIILVNPLLFTYRYEYLKIRLQGRSRVNRDLQGSFFTTKREDLTWTAIQKSTSYASQYKLRLLLQVTPTTSYASVLQDADRPYSSVRRHANTLYASTGSILQLQAGRSRKNLAVIFFKEMWNDGIVFSHPLFL